MDFIQFSRVGDSISISIDWDAINASLSSLSTTELVLLAFGVSAVYGLLTHFKSLRQISKWNKRMDAKYESRIKNHRNQPAGSAPVRHYMEQRLEDWSLVPLAAYRIFLNLPVRVVTTALGSIAAAFLFVCSGKIRLNKALRWGLTWHLPPHRIRSMLTEENRYHWDSEEYA